MRVYETNNLDFDSNGSDSWQIIIGSGNALAPNMGQSITCIYASIGPDELNQLTR